MTLEDEELEVLK